MTDKARPSSRLRAAAGWAVKIALSVGLVWFLLASVDFDSVWAETRRMRPEFLIAAALALLVQFFLAALRWQWVIAGLRARLALWRCFKFLYISMFFGLAVPFVGGTDAVRVWKSRQAGLKLSKALTSVVLDRVVGMLGLLLLVVAMQPVLFARVEQDIARWIFPAVALLGIAGVAMLMFLDRMPRAIRDLPPMRGAGQLARDTRRLFLKPGLAARTLALAVLGQVISSTVVYLLALGMGIEIDMLDCLVLVPPVILVASLPISIGGWGVREGVMVAAFALIGVPAASSLALSLSFGLLVSAVSLPGGILWLATREGRSGAMAA